ncbi:HXXEE domain-containing protein [Listeria innocua]|uniref:HXXEE domain-containing protein n=1 Tax=Listeria innocua TaxID=1642 RepID=UPI001627CB02|nr:HXXEE domain-containing protein [Listeria innocua]MBC2140454.1 HXXEE domain-containing protein [Listeria innocua]
MATIMWVFLFPSLFIIHDFEEIIYGHSWFNKNKEIIGAKVPEKLMSRLEDSLEGSVSQFAFAVLEEFIILVFLAVLTSIYQWYSFYVCLMFGYCVHAVMHLFQSIYIRKYIPATGTAIVTSILIVYGAIIIVREQNLQWGFILMELPLMMFAIFLNVVFAHWISKRLVK